MSVAEIVDIEENIWAPRYGLKGQLDGTLRVQVTSRDPLQGQARIDQYLSASVGRAATSGVSGSTSGWSVGVSCSTDGRTASAPSVPSNGAMGRAGGGSGGVWSGGVVRSSGGGEVTRSYLVPFEFKSGKEYMGHRGQVG